MKNQLLYYQGGGYAGCIWEWNFCFWDNAGVWHNLYASGCDGAKTEQQALKIAETLKFSAELVDLTNAERFRQFQQDNNARLVLNIAQILNVKYNYQIEVKCTECGDSFGAIDEGDIAIGDSTIICADCSACGTCDCCNEYVGQDDLNHCNEDNDDNVSANLADLGYYAVCSDCFEYNREEFERDNLKDLVFQAFCTGEPDIFSEQLREYWS